ncbi:macro domain-containing protein [Oscillatoria sp. FACHB-1406]|uniref:macro domain-containing protein n=1 Tax=Oscillatoria sp. FACHB-1406 TaxID=2692846 RepID=UPI0016822D53|nr:macro domain-containing protein [Oscillatoria sp. FACHB-1406]MBD2579809.1 macro domain-containing protein [Oscillatoria sp. FACHB-1406]
MSIINYQLFKLLAECRTLGSCKTGSAKITRGYNLPAQYIIHTVGPVWRGGNHGEAELLASCYTSSLQLALENGVKTIAFPAISCGVYGYPIPQAARIAFSVVRQFQSQHNSLECVTFVCFSEETDCAYLEAETTV